MAEHSGLGAGRQQVVVSAQSGRAVSVGRGDLVRVVDIEGHQVGDLWAVDAADHGRWLSASHTRDRCERLFPAGQLLSTGAPSAQAEATNALEAGCPTCMACKRSGLRVPSAPHLRRSKAYHGLRASFARLQPDRAILKRG